MIEGQGESLLIGPTAPSFGFLNGDWVYWPNASVRLPFVRGDRPPEGDLYPSWNQGLNDIVNVQELHFATLSTWFRRQVADQNIWQGQNTYVSMAS